MAKIKNTNVTTTEPVDSPVATAVASRLAARLAEAKADWTALIVEAAMLGVHPPAEVIRDVADRLRLDQPQIRFRLAAEAFQSAVRCIGSAHLKAKQVAELENEIGLPSELKTRIAELETELAAARNLLRRQDGLMLSAGVPVGRCRNICREWQDCFSMADVEKAAGQ